MADNDGFRNDWATKDFYAVLGVSKDATADDIKKAYRKLARANHPDSNPDDAAKHEKFKAVAEAYDVVGDADKRKKYDEFRTLSAGGGGFGGGFPTGFNRGGTGQGGFDINDLLREQGGGWRLRRHVRRPLRRWRAAPAPRHRAPPRATTSRATTTLGFEDALNGTTISLRLTSDAPCPTCKGTGGKPGTRPHICPECEGAGFVVASSGGGSR